MPGISVSSFDCATNTLTGTVSGCPPFPDSVCAYAYCVPAQNVPACAPAYATCLPWSLAQQGSPGSSTFQIPGVARESGCQNLEIVVWGRWCVKNSFLVTCTTTTSTTTTSTTTTSTTTTPRPASTTTTTTTTHTLTSAKQGAAKRAK